MTTTPSVWLAEFAVNTSGTPGNQSHAQSISLRDGRLLTVWADNTNNTDASPGTDIIGQLYSSTGSRIGQPLQLNEVFQADNERAPVIAALPDGGFIIVHEQLGTGAGGNAAVRFEIYNANGTHVTGRSLDSGTIGGGENSQPTVTVLSDGNVAVTYQRLVNGNADAITRIIDMSTYTPGARLDAGGNDAGDDEKSPDSAQLTNDYLVSVYERDKGAHSSIEFKIINLSGSTVGSVTELSANGHDAHVSALSGGGFGAVWLDDNDGTLRAEIHDNSGAVSAQDFVVAGAAADPSNADIVALKDGGFFVTWIDGVSHALRGQRVDALGGTVGNAVTIASGASVSDASTSLTHDGRILVTFNDASGEIAEVILDPRDNIITGTGLRDAIMSRTDGATIYGLDGNDTIRGLGANDKIYGGNGRDLLIGSNGNDGIYGGSGNDVLNGGHGVDNAKGGAGDDTFVYNTGDNIGTGHVADGGSGHDRILVGSSVWLTTTRISAIEEVEFASGSSQVSSAGFLASQIGNGLASDLLIDFANGKTDNLKIVMKTELNLDLSELEFQDFTNNAAEHDRVRIRGDADSEYIHGSSVMDAIAGGAGNDTLDGGLATDRLYGGDGDDTYFVNVRGEARERAGEGEDTVRSAVSYLLNDNIENLVLLGTRNHYGAGNGLDNEITGNSGSNALNGRGGNDILTGGGGRDYFVFKTALDAANNVDDISDFVAGTDKFRLDDAVFTGLTTGTLKAGMFVAGTAAADSNDHVIYDSATGTVYFDADGAGGADQVAFAQVTAGLSLSSADFAII